MSRRWKDCNSKWQRFVSDQKEVEEWLSNAENTLKLSESEPAAHRQQLRVTPNPPLPYLSITSKHEHINMYLYKTTMYFNIENPFYLNKT